MKYLISQFTTALISEQIKNKGTYIYLLSLIIGVLSPFILFISRLNHSTRFIPNHEHNAFLNFFENSLELYAYYFLPFLIILVTSRITQLEHSNRGWQLLDTLPIQKWVKYFSKFTIIIILNIISITTYLVLGIIFMYLLASFGIISNLASLEFPFSLLINIYIRLIVASLFLSALQYSISVLISNFLWPILIGIIGFSINTFFNETNIFWNWYPYSALSHVFHYASGSELGHILTYVDYLSMIACFIILIIGYLWYKNKQLKSIIYEGRKRLIKVSILLAILIAMFISIQQPKQLHTHNHTILKGEIISHKAIKNIFVIEPFLKDTLAVIPIVNNSFRHQFKNNITLQSYDISFDDAIKGKIIFGTKDSIQLKILIGNNYNKLDVKGTRLAENKKQNQDAGSLLSYYMEDNVLSKNPTQFFNKFINECKERTNALSDFRTVDNYKLRKDYLELTKELLTVEYHYYLNEYKKRYTFHFPNKVLIIPLELRQFEKPLIYNEALLNNDYYLNSILDQIANNSSENIDRNTKLLNGISLLKEGSFKDKLLVSQLGKSLKDASNPNEIDQLILKYPKLISNKKLRRTIISKAKLTKCLSIGNNAPDIAIETTNGKLVTLNDFKGKFILIDVWATWCRPCKKDIPYFEKFALKYQNEPIQFISINVNRNKNNWLLKIDELPKSVTQLRALNIKDFMKIYNIERIPRYILIDPDGKILNNDFPRPSKSVFEPTIKTIFTKK